MISGGSLDGSQFNLGSAIITAGDDNGFTVIPDATNQIGTIVPEPSSFAALAGLAAALGLLAVRRRQRR